MDMTTFNGFSIDLNIQSVLWSNGTCSEDITVIKLSSPQSVIASTQDRKHVFEDSVMYHV